MSESISIQAHCGRLIESQGRAPDADRLQQLFSYHWEHKMSQYPEWATQIGHPGYDGLWTDWSFEAVEARKAAVDLQLKALDSISQDQLIAEDQLSSDILRWTLNDEKGEYDFPRELLPLTHMDGVQQDAARILAMMPARTGEQIESIVSRLERLPLLVDQTIALMQEGMRQGITHPRVTMADVPSQIKNQIVNSPSQPPMLAAMSALPRENGDRISSLVRDAEQLYADKVAPSLTKLLTFVESEYIPACRETTAWSDLPKGRQWYEWHVRRNTTTDMTPDEVFAVGQSEVARIRDEMTGVMKLAGFSDFAVFCDHLRTDPQFYFDSPKELLSAYRDIVKRVDPELIRFFGILPRLPYGVIPIPSYAEKSQTTAYYQPGSLKGGRPGYYYANTYDLKSRPKWEMEALSLHEAVPGHHLQIALAQEMENLPEFRKNLWITAYGEGWALYSESLGEQMGFYADPYAKFGQLSYEMWRAIRLVVDPGLHAKGWSREKAIQFFAANSSKPMHDMTVEIDRYIVWPGQAISYKTGELKIRQLRKLAETKLRERFDIRAFHDELLSTGCIPLDLLERRIGNWIERRSHT